MLPRVPLSGGPELEEPLNLGASMRAILHRSFPGCTPQKNPGHPPDFRAGPITLGGNIERLTAPVHTNAAT